MKYVYHGKEYDTAAEMAEAVILHNGANVVGINSKRNDEHDSLNTERLADYHRRLATYKRNKREFEEVVESCLELLDLSRSDEESIRQLISIAKMQGEAEALFKLTPPVI